MNDWASDAVQQRQDRNIRLSAEANVALSHWSDNESRWEAHLAECALCQRVEKREKERRDAANTM